MSLRGLVGVALMTAKSALYEDTAAQFGIHMNTELGLVVDVE